MALYTVCTNTEGVTFASREGVINYFVHNNIVAFKNLGVTGKDLKIKTNKGIITVILPHKPDELYVSNFMKEITEPFGLSLSEKVNLALK